jgi:hypothetical protein
LADHSGVPVGNGLTTEWHPTQMLADIRTLTEHDDGSLEQIACCFFGDGRNNVARSLLIAAVRLGMDLRNRGAAAAVRFGAMAPLSVPAGHTEAVRGQHPPKAGMIAGYLWDGGRGVRHLGFLAVGICCRRRTEARRA